MSPAAVIILAPLAIAACFWNERDDRARWAAGPLLFLAVVACCWYAAVAK